MLEHSVEGGREVKNGMGRWKEFGSTSPRWLRGERDRCERRRMQEDVTSEDHSKRSPRQFEQTMTPSSGQRGRFYHYSDPQDCYAEQLGRRVSISSG
jgi:hypothetical protein